jgi:hypothetical protein
MHDARFTIQRFEITGVRATLDADLSTDVKARHS